MKLFRSRTLVTAALLAGGAAFAADAQEPAPQANCKAVQASMVEDASTTNCKPGHPSCFLGEVDGNQGLRGTTYFRADSAAAGPSHLTRVHQLQRRLRVHHGPGNSHDA